MTFPRSFIRHTLLWTLPGSEEASTTVGWAETSSIVSIDDPSADMLADKAATFWGAIKGAYSTEVKFIGSRLAQIGVAGNTVSVVERASTAVPGTSGGDMLPHEVAVVLSTKSNTYGRSGRGRNYLPPPAEGQSTTLGRIDSGLRDALAAAAADYLSYDSTTGLFSVVASFTTNALRPITSVECGDVWDSQRRRRDALVEVRSVEPVTTA